MNDDPNAQPELQSMPNEEQTGTELNPSEDTAEPNMQQETQNGQNAESSAEQELSPNAQKTQQLFNRIKQDPSRVLRYRIYRQHLETQH